MTPVTRSGTVSSEIRVGLFFFIGLGFALWLTFFVTRLGRPTGQFMVVFRRVSELKGGDEVAYNGVRIGSVSDVTPALDATGVPEVQVSFSIDPRIQPSVLIDRTTHFRISQELLGGAMLEIDSKHGEPITPALLAGAVGETPAGVADTVASVHDLIAENRATIHAALVGVKTAFAKFSDMADEIRATVSENRPAIRSAIPDIDRMSSQIADMVAENRATVRAAIANINRMADQIAAMVEENRVHLQATIANLPQTVENIKKASGDIDLVVDENRKDVRTIIGNLAKAAPKVDHIAQNLDTITNQIASGKGTIGKLVFDDTLHDRTLEMVDNANQRVEEIKPLTSGFADLRLYGGVTSGMDTRSGVTDTEAYLRLEPRSYKFYEAGVSYRTAPRDVQALPDDPNKFNVDFNLLVGWRFFPDDRDEDYRLTVAGGLIDGQVGGEVTTPVWGDRLLLTALVRHKDNSRDPLDRRYEAGKVMARVTLQYQPFPGYRLFIIAGGDDLIDHPSPWVAVRAELLDDDLRNLATAASLPH